MASRATAAKGRASADKAIGSSYDCDARSELGSSRAGTYVPPGSRHAAGPAASATRARL